MTTVDTLMQAIEGQKSVAFGYHGYERVVSPYACGLNTSNELKLIALQTDGGSTSGITRKVRWFTIADILGLEVCEAPYEAPGEEALATVAQLMKRYEKA